MIFLAAGSYVALTVLGRPPGLPLQDEEEPEDTGALEEGELNSSQPTSPALSARQHCSLDGTGLQDDGTLHYESTEGVRTATFKCKTQKKIACQMILTRVFEPFSTKKLKFDGPPPLSF